MTGATDNETHDALISNKGTEADNWGVDKLREIFELAGKLKALPIFDISAGTVNGSTCPQDIKDLCTNKATKECFLVLRDYQAVAEYEKKVQDSLTTVQRALHTSQDTATPYAEI